MYYTLHQSDREVGGVPNDSWTEVRSLRYFASFEYCQSQLASQTDLKEVGKREGAMG